jgi:hypothetical protein
VPSDSQVRALSDHPGRPWPALSIRRPGFNRDTTIAAVSIGYWCGVRCGHITTVLLARRPGHQWRRWHSLGGAIF